MVPKVTSKGRSFKGAARYYLHDKKADTAERVAFTEALNLPTNDPHRATAHMIDTAAHANDLKREAGIKAGRTLKHPVYTYSLAWHPSQNPTKAEQIAAARESLHAIGMTDRQALIVAHCDTDHAHVHVVVNRVCPTTGRAASYSNDQLKLSQWAEEYERRHGKIFCQERVANNAERQNGNWRKAASQPRNQYLEWKKATTKQLWDQHRADTAANKADRGHAFQALWEQRENRMATRKAETKKLYKPIWRDVFKRQRQELRTFDNSLKTRLSFARTNYSGLESAKAMVRAFTADQGQRRDFEREQERERAAIAERQRQIIRDASREVTKAWKYDREQLVAAYRQDDQTRFEQTKAETDRIWKSPPPPEQTRAEFWDAASKSAEAQRPPQSREEASGRAPDPQTPPEPRQPTQEAERGEQPERHKTTREMLVERQREKRKRSRGRTRKR